MGAQADVLLELSSSSSPSSLAEITYDSYSYEALNILQLLKH